ncbi:glycosyltransferase family 2 protein [Flavobacterium yafengii]|uniref:Glycosyltransferase n=1 Tax=Flavobacterium yafengii TaxID=3041253 RepID=A0AAW6TSU1_9FLAO|nr:glycosyltransferase [Flavobacterium yafengii]MDI5950693.1 glycosyltransferase [Flavobacterium yafengii]
MVAIVIPYYKITFFEETLQSLANQTDKRFKVYIGNDASPETPTDLLEKYKGQFDFVYHRFETNLGSTSLVQQWHRCISLMQNEEWLLVLGDDDVLQDNFVSAFYENRNKIEALKINVIRYATAVINDKGEVISKLYIHPKLEKSTDFLMRKLKGGTRSSLSEFIFRRADFDKVKFKDLPLAWYSDYLAVLEVSNFSFLYTINNSQVYFRHSSLNITSKRDNLKAKNIATFGFYHYLLYDKKHFFDSEQLAVLRTRLEKTFLDNKKNVYFWMQFIKLYVTSFYFKQYLIFMFNVIQAILKKNK